MDEELFEVYFDQYCPMCKHEKLEETKDPCDECLGSPCNRNSHKPINWEKKDGN